MEKERFAFLAMLLMWLAIPLSTEAKKVKYNAHLYYEGEVSKGKPNGEGTLYCTLEKVDNFGSGFMKFITDKNYNPLTAKKAKDGVCDVITGTFSGNRVTDATVKFNSGWGYEGNLIFDTSNEKAVTISFIEGVFSVPTNYQNCPFNEIMVVDTCYMARRYEDFFMKTSVIKAHPGGIKGGQKLGEIPASFLRDQDLIPNIELVQSIENGKEQWRINYFRTDVYSSENKKCVLKFTDNTSNGSLQFIYALKNEPITFYDTKGMYIFHFNDGDVARDSSFQCMISYKNGNTFKGKTRFRGVGYSDLSPTVSLDPHSKFYIGKYNTQNSIENCVVPYEGILTYADGRSVRYVEGMTEEAYKAKKLQDAKKEEERRAQIKKADEERLAQAKKAEAERRAQQIANQKKEAEARKAAQAFIKTAWGKTFRFKKSKMANVVDRGEYSVKFLENRQDIIVRVDGREEWLKFSNYCDDGKKLECHLWGDYSLTGTVYITPIKHEGKWRLKLLYIDGMNTEYYLFN